MTSFCVQNPVNKGEEMLPLDMDDLPEFFVQKAIREINYSPYGAEKTLGELKRRIGNEDTLQELKFFDTQLNIFLTCKKFSVDKAFEHLIKWNKFRKKHPEAFYIPTYEVLSPFMTDEMVTLLPWRCQDGCAVLFIDFGKYNSRRHPLEPMKQFFTFVILQCLRKPMTQVNGFKVIINLDAPMEILKICTPTNLHLFMYGIFAISPARFKAVHFLNAFGIGRVIWQTGKFFLPAKVRERVEIHKTSDTLVNYFPREILPSNLGGNLKDYDMTWWLKKYLAPEEKCAFEF